MQYKTNSILVSYELKYQFKLCDYIQFTSDLKKCFNFHSGKEITTENNMKKGFWYNRKFYRLSEIESLVELIPKYQTYLNDYLTDL